MRRIARHVLLLPPIVLIGGMVLCFGRGIDMFASDDGGWEVLIFISLVSLLIWGLTE